MSEYKLKTGKLGETLVGAYKKIEDVFVENFLNEDGTMKTGGMADKAVSAYQKVENTFVGGYQKIEDAFVDTFLEKTEEKDEKREEAEFAAGSSADER